MNRYARRFQITVWIGILMNVGLGLTGLFAPDWLLRTMGFDVAYPNVWPRFASWLLLLLSLFYIPGANDLNRYRANAVLSVCARFSGVVFFTGAVVLVGFSSRYLLFGAFDLVIGVPSAIFLVQAIRLQREEEELERRRTAILSKPRATGATNVVAAEEVAQTR
jgi:hypothetical protein